MEAWVIEWIARLGYLGIALLIALENVFPPIPSELVLCFGGFLSVHAGLSVLGVSLAATAGAVAGALILYRVGGALGSRRARGVAEKRLGLKGSDIDRAVRWFERLGGKAVFFGRMVPLVRSVVSIPAGMAAMPMGVFLLLSTAGSFLWNVLFASLGALLGHSWRAVLVWAGLYGRVVVALLLFAAAAGLYALAVRRREA